MQYGKFNTAEELLKGYTELEKSFTQKCQELSALRNEISHNNEHNNETVTSGGTSDNSPPPTEDTGAAAAEHADTVPAENDASSAVGASPTPQQQPLPRVMNGGGNLSMALPSRPKTLTEASAMAKELFGGV